MFEKTIAKKQHMRRLEEAEIEAVTGGSRINRPRTPPTRPASIPPGVTASVIVPFGVLEDDGTVGSLTGGDD